MDTLQNVRFKSDKDISDEYKGYKVMGLEFRVSRNSGYIDLEFPNGAEDRCDSFIIYDSGKIAFDNWYPDWLYFELVQKINKGRNKKNV